MAICKKLINILSWNVKFGGARSSAEYARGVFQGSNYKANTGGLMTFAMTACTEGLTLGKNFASDVLKSASEQIDQSYKAARAKVAENTHQMM